MNENYTTYDLGLSASLVTYGAELVRIDKENPKKALFVFKGKINAGLVSEHSTAEVAKSYFDGVLTLPALELVNSLKNLKNRLYSVN